MLELKSDTTDGEFWMAFQDFQQYFDMLEICHLYPESLWHDENNRKINNKRWNVSTHHGQWIKGESAGGSIKYPGKKTCRVRVISFLVFSLHIFHFQKRFGEIPNIK